MEKPLKGFELVRENLDVEVERLRQVEQVEELDLVRRRRDSDRVARGAGDLERVLYVIALSKERICGIMEPH